MPHEHPRQATPDLFAVRIDAFACDAAYSAPVAVLTSIIDPSVLRGAEFAELRFLRRVARRDSSLDCREDEAVQAKEPFAFGCTRLEFV